jgi:tetraacyldisaccharide 4'-kinase
MRWELLLTPLTPLYAAAVRVRCAAYRLGTLRSQRLPAPVVSVGNLTFGGTGKTPTVTALVRDLARRGRRPAVLTRGYGRRDKTPLVLIGPDTGFAAERAGDEPLEMAERLPGVPIVVDADRARGGREAIRHGADVLILDDGFQHLAVARDLDIVLLDAGDPWGGGHLPPIGRLREPVTAVRRASAVIVSKLEADHDGVFEEIRERLHRLAPSLPVLGAGLAASRLRTPGGPRPLATIEGRQVLAFAGLGRPQGFERLLERCGARVVSRRWFPDHHLYARAELATLVDQARRLNATLVTTAKDAVKLPADMPAWVVEASVQPVGESWDPLWRIVPGLTG